MPGPGFPDFWVHGLDEILQGIRGDVCTLPKTSTTGSDPFACNVNNEVVNAADDGCRGFSQLSNPGNSRGRIEYSLNIDSLVILHIKESG